MRNHKKQSGQNRKLVIRFAPADEIHILRTPDVQFYLVFLDVWLTHMRFKQNASRNLHFCKVRAHHRWQQNAIFESSFAGANEISVLSVTKTQINAILHFAPYFTMLNAARATWIYAYVWSFRGGQWAAWLVFYRAKTTIPKCMLLKGKQKSRPPNKPRWGHFEISSWIHVGFMIGKHRINKNHRLLSFKLLLQT